MAWPQGLNGERLAHHFGVRAASTLATTRPRTSPLVMTRLQGVPRRGTTEPLRPEPAFSILLQLRPLDHHDLEVGGRRTYSGAVPAGAVSVVSLSDLPRSAMSGTFDALQFYVPENLLDDVAEEEGFKRPTDLSWPRARPDPVLVSLAELLLPAVEAPDRARAMFVEHLTLAVLSHVTQSYGGVTPRENPVRSGLAPWQERRAKELMRAHLASSLTMTEVSRECRLSPSYFAAAFRRSTGRSPQRFLSELRVSEAKSLMMTTDQPLAEVALLCGFSDQSYFNRVFSRLVGNSPGSWRRLHALGAKGARRTRIGQECYGRALQHA